MNFLRGRLRKTKRDKTNRLSERGLLLFENTSEVIRAEKLLRGLGHEIKVMGPPPEVQKGCDLVIDFPLLEEMVLVRALKEADNPPLQVVPVSGPLLTPVDIYHTKDFGEYLMVRAANMKITVDKASRTIVNVSGGGCPDVPYLAGALTGKTLDEAPRPRDLGHTLCGYALDMAFEHIKMELKR